MGENPPSDSGCAPRKALRAGIPCRKGLIGRSSADTHRGNAQCRESFRLSDIHTEPLLSSLTCSRADRTCTTLQVVLAWAWAAE